RDDVLRMAPIRARVTDKDVKGFIAHVDGHGDVRQRALAGKRRRSAGYPGQDLSSSRKNSTWRWRRPIEERLEARARIPFAEAVKIAALQVSKESGRLARLDKDRQRKVRPISDGGPLRCATLPS